LNFQNDLLSSLPRHLSNDQTFLCEGAMTLGKISFAVINMNTNESPEPDGLTVKFFRKFWDLLGPYLVYVYNECFDLGEMCVNNTPVRFEFVFILTIHLNQNNKYRN